MLSEPRDEHCECGQTVRGGRHHRSREPRAPLPGDGQNWSHRRQHGDYPLQHLDAHLRQEQGECHHRRNPRACDRLGVLTLHSDAQRRKLGERVKTKVLWELEVVQDASRVSQRVEDAEHVGAALIVQRYQKLADVFQVGVRG